jgi:putative addiction module killer protein
MEYGIKVYETRKGVQPFMDWLRKLKDGQGRTAVRVRLDRVKLGNFGDCQSVGEGVSEIRIDIGPGYRVYFGMMGRTIVLLLTGGDKKSQHKDIQLAKEFFRDHKQREKEHGKL